MRLLKNRFFGFYLAFILILAMTIGGSAVAAFASVCDPTTPDCGQAQVTLQGQTGVTESSTFPGVVPTVTLNGKNQFPTYTLPIKVTDATGSGDGWHLQISGADLSDTATIPHTLTEQVTLVSSSGCAGSDGCTPATGTPTVGFTIGTTPTTFFSAAKGSGLGIISVSATIQITVPGNAYAATYSTTLTVASFDGP